MNWEIIIPTVLGIVALICGIRWKQVANLLKQTGELLLVVADAMEDDKISKDEVASILKESVDVVSAVKKLMGK